MEQYKSTLTRKEIENELAIVRNGKITDGNISGDLNIGGELTVLIKFSRNIYSISSPCLKLFPECENFKTFVFLLDSFENDTATLFHNNTLIKCTSERIGNNEEDVNKGYVIVEYKLIVTDIIDLTKLSKPEYELIVTENALSNRSDLNTLIKSLINGDDFPIVYINYNNYKIQTSLSYDKTNTKLSITALNSKTLIHVSYQYYPNQGKVYGGGIEIYNSITDLSPKLISLSPITA